MRYFFKGLLFTTGILLLFVSFYLDDIRFLRDNQLNGSLNGSLEEGSEESEFEILFQRLEQKSREIMVSFPIIGPESNSQARQDLRRDQIVIETNVQREVNGLPSLETSSRLIDSAKLKIDDMFENQYFAHDSPEGVTLDNLANQAGYDFIAIGENLAMGLFRNEADLLEAWMNSPSHKENILNPNFTEIGIYAKRGKFGEQETILIVQHFGRPSEHCPSVDRGLQALIIDQMLPQIDQLSEVLRDRKEVIDEMSPRDSQYDQLVEEYNQLVEEYNQLVEEARNSMEVYNQQVSAFNQCAAM